MFVIMVIGDRLIYRKYRLVKKIMINIDEEKQRNSERKYRVVKK